MSYVTLGLDIGPNSIGWALVDEENQRIIDLGVRVFPEGVDNFDTKKEKSRNEDRRIARAMRRQTARRARRKTRLRDALIQSGLFPAAPDEHDALYQLNPYELRAKALDEKLTPHQIGRVFLHLNQRRGFLSNRKKDRGDKEVKGMLQEIGELSREIAESGSRTLGEYLFRKYQSFDHAQRAENDHVRNRHTRRDMLETEFVAIWDAQARHHPEVLTEQLRYGALGKGSYPCKPRRKPKGMSDLEAFGLHGMIFFQRKMYWPKSVVGLCDLEPKEKRCQRFDRHAQRFRLLQEVNNLRYIDPDSHEECGLDEQQRTLLLDYLGTREKATFDQIRKKLGFLESVKFNLERGRRPSLKGMVVDWMMAKEIGKNWHKRPEEEKDEIVRLLLDNEREDDVIAERLVSEFGLTADQADAALGVDFPSGYVSLSLKAIDKLLPHLEKGLVYEHADPSKSARAEAGYDEPWALQRRLFDRLPDPARMNPRDCPIGDIPNPVVKRTLTELRKVVNAIIREYGKPDAVHVEMGRDVKTRPKDKTSPAYRKYIQEEEARAERERKRTAAKQRLRESGIPFGAGGRNILKLLLWEEQEQICIYSGRPISFAQLVSDEVEIDHILPRSQSLDDSQMNKVVCFHSENHPATGKGKRTPREWLEHSNPVKYSQVCQRAKKLPYGKYRRFLQQKVELEGCITRQLNDTRYIARATVEYLRLLVEHDHDVIGLKGQLTSTVRRLWGLDTILADLPDSPAWQEQAKVRPGEKNRADHRHHAIDALVVALTNRTRLQKLSRGFTVEEFTDQERETGEPELKNVYRGEHISVPWGGFRNDVVRQIRRIDGCHHGDEDRRGVSHRPERKVAGALHEDTFYGPTAESGVFVVRKPLETLSPNEIPLIRDERIRQVIETRLTEHGIEIGRGKKVVAKKWKEALCDTSNPVVIPPSKKRLKRDPSAQGVPIKKVRVYRHEQTIQPIREGRADEAYVKPGSTHHLAIFEWKQNGKRKRDAVFVTQLDAINRVKNGEQVIQRTPPPNHATIPPDAQFVMSLSRGEMVLANWKGNEKLLVFKTAASTQGQIYLSEHTDSRRSSEYQKHVANANTLDARKVTVDPLGRIRWAND